jgi:hypothetical protein
MEHYADFIKIELTKTSYRNLANSQAYLNLAISEKSMGNAGISVSQEELRS